MRIHAFHRSYPLHIYEGNVLSDKLLIWLQDFKVNQIKSKTIRHCIRGVLVIAISVLLSGCNNGSSTNSHPDTNPQPIAEAPASVARTTDEIYIRTEKLSPQEKAFLKILQKENPVILISEKVRRVYQNKTLIYTQPDIPQDTLDKNGYVYYGMTIWGDIVNDDLNITYLYSLGQAYYGYGSIYGPSTKEYFHAHTSYGTGAKIVELYNNGKKLYSKTVPLPHQEVDSVYEAGEDKK